MALCLAVQLASCFVVRHRVLAVFPGFYQQSGLVDEARCDPTFQCRTGDGPPLVIRP